MPKSRTRTIYTFMISMLLSLTEFKNSSAFILRSILLQPSTQDNKIYHHAMKETQYNKKDVNNILREIGLEPVEKNNVRKNKRKRNPDTLPKNSQRGSLSTTRNISLKTQLEYSRNGHAALRSFIPPQIITTLRPKLVKYSAQKALQAWRQKVEVATNSTSIAKRCNTIPECRSALKKYKIPLNDLPFLQYFNLWKDVSEVEKIVKSPLLASAAAQLLDVPRVKLYQDSLFHKRQNDGKTPWHSDARMTPFDTQHLVTFWIPFQVIPRKGGTGLVFVDKSHSDFALPYWNGVMGEEYDRLEERYGMNNVRSYMPLQVGDVTVHSGWTLHCADACFDKDDRYALAVSYVDARAEIRDDVLMAGGVNGDDEDRQSFQEWVKDVKPRCQFEHESVPVVWPPVE